MRLLVIPALTSPAAASPFHCCLVPPGSKEPSNGLPNLDDNWSFAQFEFCLRDGRHRALWETRQNWFLVFARINFLLMSGLTKPAASQKIGVSRRDDSALPLRYTFSGIARFL